jgi:hypothetical protein
VVEERTWESGEMSLIKSCLAAMLVTSITVTLIVLLLNVISPKSLIPDFFI